MGNVMPGTKPSSLQGRGTETLRPEKDFGLEAVQAAWSMKEQSLTDQEHCTN